MKYHLFEPYFAKTPKIIQNIFSDYIWRMPAKKDPVCRQERNIYLTFDDGPIPEITDWILKTLDKFHTKATFFCVGDNIQKHPEIFQSVLNKDHSIGNHTFNHLNGWRTNTKKYLENLKQTEEIIDITSTKVLPSGKDLEWDQNLFHRKVGSKLFRPPYGKIKPAQRKILQKKGYQIIMWDVLSGDFDPGLSKENCLQNVMDNVQNGSIIVFHDSIKAFEKLQYVLPKVLQHFTQKGYTFKKIPM